MLVEEKKEDWTVSDCTFFRKYKSYCSVTKKPAGGRLLFPIVRLWHDLIADSQQKKQLSLRIYTGMVSSNVTLLEFWLCGVGIAVFGVFGVLANLCSLIYLKSNINKTFTSLIFWLAIIDSLFLVR